MISNLASLLALVPTCVIFLFLWESAELRDNPWPVNLLTFFLVYCLSVLIFAGKLYLATEWGML